MLQRVEISRSIAFRRLFVTAASRPLRAAPANGGFGEEERQKKGNEGTKDCELVQHRPGDLREMHTCTIPSSVR